MLVHQPCGKNAWDKQPKGRYLLWLLVSEALFVLARRAWLTSGPYLKEAGMYWWHLPSPFTPSRFLVNGMGLSAQSVLSGSAHTLRGVPQYPRWLLIDQVDAQGHTWWRISLSSAKTQAPPQSSRGVAGLSKPKQKAFQFTLTPLLAAWG